VNVRKGLFAAIAAGVIAALLIPAVGAGAAPGHAKGHAYGRVFYPTVQSARARRAQQEAAGQASANNLNYGGGVDGIGVTTGPPKIYLVFWGSQWGTANPAGSTNLSGDTVGMAPRLQALFSGLGTNNELWSGVATQYCDGVAIGAQTCPASNALHVGYPTGGALAGIWDDTAAAAPSQATGHQIAVEAINAAAHFGNTANGSNRNVQYDIVSPHNTHPDGFNTPSGNWCAWHDYNGDTTLTGGAASSPYGDIAFTNMPYVTDAGSSCGQNFVNGSAGTLDGVTIVNGHEFSETITDQNPAGGWTDSSGEENADKCAWILPGQPGGAQDVAFATGSFAMQSTWSNDTNGCAISHAIVTNGGANDFSIGVSPTSRSVVVGSSTTATVSTATTSGSAQSVALSASGLPTGASASFSPASVTSGGSSTLTIQTSASTPAGTFPVTITGSAASGSHATSLSLTVTTTPPPNDFSVSVSPTNATVTAGGSTNATVSTATTSGSAQSVSLSASGLPTGASASFSPASVTSGASSTMTVTTAATTPAGSYTITVTGSAASGTHGATFLLTVNAASGGNTLTNGVPVTGISGAINSQKTWTLSVPAAQDTLTFKISGGTGDADLYVRFGAAPTLTTYNCRPYITGNNETCTFSAPSAGTWYVMLNGYAAYSGVTLTGTYSASTATVLVNGVPVTAIAGATGSTKFWVLSVPAGQAKVVFTISGGTGDADLYVRYNAKPTTSAYNCRPYLVGNNESCTITAPAAGNWYVMIRGYAAYSGVTLKGLYP
jgi:serine protease